MRRMLPAALVALAAAAAFAHTLGYQFVYDDVWVILNNDRIHSLANWREILTSPWWSRGLYRPFTSLTYAADWALGGGSPIPFHFNNVLLHAAASLLVYALAGRLLPRAAALAAALLFALHPVHVEAVANLVGRAEILAAGFTVAAALCYLRHGDAPAREREGGGRAAAFATLLFALLGFASKESALAAPGLLLVADWAAAGRQGEAFLARFTRQWRLWAGVVVSAAMWLALRAWILGEVAGDSPAPGLASTGVGERVVIMLPVVAEYLRLLLFPARLSADYSPDFLPVSTAFSARAALGLLLLAVSAGAAFAARRRAPVVTAGIAWVGAGLVIVSNILVPSGILLAERTLYLASVGVCLALAWVWMEGHRRAAPAAVTALVAVLALAAFRTTTRAPVWRDNTALFSRLVRDAPGSYRADWVGGMLAYTAGDSARGEMLMRRGLKIFAGNGAMWSDFAKVMERQRRWREAADYHWAAFTADPRLELEAARAVAAAVQAGELDTAAARLAAAERVLPPSTDLSLSASHLALARGDAVRATGLRASIARAHPEDYRYWLLAGWAALRARDCAILDESVARLTALRSQLPPLAGLREGLTTLRCRASLSRSP